MVFSRFRRALSLRLRSHGVAYLVVRESSSEEAR